MSETEYDARTRIVQAFDNAEQESYTPPALESYVRMKGDTMQEVRMQNNDRPECEWCESSVVRNLEDNR